MAAALVIIGLVGGRAANARSAITRPVERFIHFYQVTENTVSPMSVWERVMFSLMLTKTDAVKTRG